MKKLLFLFGVFLVTLQSCDTCKHIPTYGGRAAMVYGHSGDGMKAKKNPYAVKAKVKKYRYVNRYK